MSDRPDPFDRAVDVALEERLGGAHPPDLCEAVLARLDREAGAPQTRPLWLAAAVLLLGAGVVTAVLALRDTRPAPEARGAVDAAPPGSASDAAGDPQDPEPEIVRPTSIGELRELLARSTGFDLRVRSDRGIDLDPRGPGRIRRSGLEGPGLRVLADAPLERLEPAGWTWSHEIDVHVGDGEALRLAWNPTDDILGVHGFGDVRIGERGAELLDDLVTHAGRSARLQQGHLLGEEVTGEDAEDLPFPESGRVTLHAASFDQALGLARLPWHARVRSLSLAASPQAVRDGSPAVGNLVGLEELVLDGLTLAPGALSRLEVYPKLRRIQLRAVRFLPPQHEANQPVLALGALLHTGISLDLRAARIEDAYGFRSVGMFHLRGPDRDRAGDGIHLDISDTSLGSGFVRTLADFRVSLLRSLRAERNPAIDDAVLATILGAGPVAGAGGDAGGPTRGFAFELRALHLASNPLTASGIAQALRGSRQPLVSLTLDDLPVTSEVLRALAVATTGSSEPSTDHAAVLMDLAVRADGHPTLVDDDCALVARLTRLERLDLVGQTRLTDRGLAALARAPALQFVDLTGCTGVTADGIRLLRARGVTVLPAER